MSRIALFGGSFNPLHNGHIALCEAVLHNGLAEEVWLMVSPQNPWKKAECLLPDAVRLELAQAAVGNRTGVTVSDFEFSLPRPSYTYRTLRALAGLHPDKTFSLLIGGDNWVAFHEWRNWEEILREYTIIIYPRAGANIADNALPEGVCLMSVPLCPYSSTDVRARLAAGLDVSGMLPPEELALIHARRLYGAKNDTP